MVLARPLDFIFCQRMDNFYKRDNSNTTLPPKKL
jgi:hypothetical protein